MRGWLIALALIATPAAAQTPADMTESQRERASALFKEIRCPTCTSQAVAESDASLSQDLRRRIGALIVAGKTDEEILQELSLTYGEDIRLRPVRAARTYPLWMAPWAILLVGGAMVIVRRKRS